MLFIQLFFFFCCCTRPIVFSLIRSTRNKLGFEIKLRELYFFPLPFLLALISLMWRFVKMVQKKKMKKRRVQSPTKYHVLHNKVERNNHILDEGRRVLVHKLNTKFSISMQISVLLCSVCLWVFYYYFFCVCGLFWFRLVYLKQFLLWPLLFIIVSAHQEFSERESEVEKVVPMKCWDEFQQKAVIVTVLLL